jgi:sodium transport system permease protein
MSQPMGEPLVGTDPSDPLHRFQRVMRLAVKELREILRDRRTLLTLILMPLLLYPLLSLVLRKFMFEGGIPTGPPTYAVACDTTNESNWVQWMVKHGRPLAERRIQGEPLPQLSFFVAKIQDNDEAKVESERALHAGQVDVVVRITRFPPEEPKVTDIWELDCEFVIVKGSISGERATRFLEDCFRAVGARFFAARLEEFGIRQRPSPVRVTRLMLESQGKSSVVSL